ncbi:MAG: LamG domain-containing protein [Desulfamplus sp.]|nr:LamG domain-containing protein [Desulfamplus sp.]
MKKCIIKWGLAAIFLFGLVEVVQADLNEGLIAYYPFNGNANDESGNGNDGIINGATLTADRNGKADSAYNFDGMDDWITIPAGNNIKFATKDSYTISIITLIKKTNGTVPVSGNTTEPYEGGRLFERYGCPQRSVYSRDALSFDYYDTSIQFGARDNKSGDANGQSLSHPIDYDFFDKYHHLVGVRDADNELLKLYIDGNLIGSDSFPTLGNMESDLKIYFGKAVACNHNVNPWDPDFRFLKGIIDEIRIYNRALNEDEILSLYSETGNGDSGIVTDSDNDGVIDQWDKCPDTLPDSFTNREGCSSLQLGLISDGEYTQADLDAKYNDGYQAGQQDYVCSGKPPFTGDLPEIIQSYLVLTDNSAPFYLSAGNYVQSFGSEGSNTVNVEKYARVQFRNFIGSNIVNIEEASSEFTVYRSGATLYLNSTSGTRIEIAATATPQILKFADGSLQFAIHDGNVLLGNQVLDAAEVLISSSLNKNDTSQSIFSYFSISNSDFFEETFLNHNIKWIPRDENCSPVWLTDYEGKDGVVFIDFSNSCRGAQMELTLDNPIDISDIEILEVDFRIDEASLSGDGWYGGSSGGPSPGNDESPFNIVLTFSKKDAEDVIFYRLFNYQHDNNSANNIYFTLVEQSTWIHKVYDKSEMNIPEGYQLAKIRIWGDGWNGKSYIDYIGLK